MRLAQAHSVDTLARHLDPQRVAGDWPVPFWTLGTRSPGLAATLARQCHMLRDDPAEIEAIGFAETAANGIEDWQ